MSDSVTIELERILKDNKLNRLSSEFGTDKDSPHSYIQNFYQGFFSSFEAPKRLVEIGIWRGASCALWKIAFPECRVTGVDISIDELHPLAGELVDQGKIELIKLDAYSQSFSEAVGRNIDLLIDDGPHTIKTQILALNYRNLLSEKGTILIEDIQKGAIDVRRLKKSLPKNVRSNCQYVSFAGDTGRYDDIIFVYSNSKEVLDFVSTLRKSFIYWGLRYFALHYPYKAYRRLLRYLNLKQAI